jgi:hypothetical protein
MTEQYNLTGFSKTQNIQKLETVFFEDCGISVDTTIEYCETPKGIHFIVIHKNYGDLIDDPKIDSILVHNNNLVMEVLEKNLNLKPTLTLVYDVSKINNLNASNGFTIIVTSNKYTDELNVKAIPLGYRQFIGIVAGPAVSIINKLTSFLPSAKNKPKTLIFKSIDEADLTLNMIRTYGYGD